MEEFFSRYMGEPELSEVKEKLDTTEVNSALLASYVGRYGGGGDVPIVITFELEGPLLRAEVNYPSLPPFFHLRPVSETAFVQEDLDIMVTFHRSTNGQVPLLTIRWLDEDSTFQRLPPWEPSNQDLQAYAGLYYSPELEIIYPLVAENTQLKLKHPFMELNLIPKKPGSFLGPWLGEYQFKRTDDGGISSFIVQNVTFEKLK